MQNITVDGMTVANGRSAVSFEGQPDVRIRGVHIGNAHFTGMSASKVVEFADVTWVASSINGVPIGEPAGTHYQAENATISQGVVESNHAGFTGTGFVNLVNAVGSYVEFAVTGPATTVAIRYANGTTATARCR